MRRALLIAAAVLLAIAGAQTAFAQGPGEYQDIVEEYRIGAADAAVGRLARWPAPAVTESVRHWSTLLRPGQLIAAAMLHTELAHAILDVLPAATDTQLQHAQTLLAALAARRDERGRAMDVRRRWFAFVTTMYLARGYADDAERYVRAGLAEFPRDAFLHLHRGTILETRANFDATDPRNDPSRRVTLSRGRALDPSLRAAQALDAAAAEYRRALELEPRMAVAQLHLGWIHIVQRDARRARDELTAALAGAPDDRVRYLAHLFLGRLAEQQNRLDEAAREYEATRQLGPAHQTPYVALSRIEAALGRIERARDLAREGIQLSVADDDDPWWNYHLGGIDGEALAWLRAEAHRR